MRSVSSLIKKASIKQWPRVAFLDFASYVLVD